MTDFVQTKFRSSILWSIVTRWSSKFIGMINTLVLARILTPADFGIIAMATIVMVMLDSMTQAGVHLYVIRQKEDDTRVFNTAWTVNLIQALVIATILFFLAPIIASFYGEKGLTEIIYCLAFIKVLNGFQSFGIFIAQKHLDFEVDFKVTFCSRIAYMITSIGFAILLESYWALIIGQLVSTISAIALSYLLHPFRPKFELYQWRKMFSFSKSTIPLNFGRFINNKADVAVVGRIASTEFLGMYHVSSTLSSLFTKELLMPLIRGIIPNLSKISENKDFHLTIRLIITYAVYVFLPIGIGLSLTSHEFVAVILGDQWIQAAPLISWLSIYAMLSGIMMFMSEQFLIILKKEVLSNRLMWMRNCFLLLMITLVLYFSDYQSLAKGVVLSALLAFPITLFYVANALSLKVLFFISLWWPAIISTIIMALCVLCFDGFTNEPLIRLCLKVMLGATAYLSSLFILYLLRGKPLNTPENLIWSKVFSK